MNKEEETDEYLQNNWVKIGTAGFRGCNSKKIPEWLLVETELTHQSKIYFGKTFVYKVIGERGHEQGENFRTYYRRLRRSVHYIKEKDVLPEKAK